jgi:hypothetical protein
MCVCVVVCSFDLHLCLFEHVMRTYTHIHTQFCYRDPLPKGPKKKKGKKQKQQKPGMYNGLDLRKPPVAPHMSAEFTRTEAIRMMATGYRQYLHALALIDTVDAWRLRNDHPDRSAEREIWYNNRFQAMRVAPQPQFHTLTDVDAAVDTLHKGVRCKPGDSNAMGGMLMANGAAKAFTQAATYVDMMRALCVCVRVYVCVCVCICVCVCVSVYVCVCICVCVCVCVKKCGVRLWVCVYLISLYATLTHMITPNSALTAAIEHKQPRPDHEQAELKQLVDVCSANEALFVEIKAHLKTDHKEGTRKQIRVHFDAHSVFPTLTLAKK